MPIKLNPIPAPPPEPSTSSKFVAPDKVEPLTFKRPNKTDLVDNWRDLVNIEVHYQLFASMCTSHKGLRLGGNGIINSPAGRKISRWVYNYLGLHKSSFAGMDVHAISSAMLGILTKKLEDLPISQWNDEDKIAKLLPAIR